MLIFLKKIWQWRILYVILRVIIIRIFMETKPILISFQDLDRKIV